ncbi:MAG TPA: 4-(cytidine 5'-diphospho)-2-C-methyl-D-erythritol kinase [Clostridiales bacterium]|jgi:4-diphosphocytidyl-2C-methyl-D-erythritol kinase|nr:4-(cytidine 5'-diphospho)-2-C-methyl-D-erythritol kinase [Clostridiales bacterium]
MKLHAYAKINLSLIVTGEQDGYHLLDSIMLSCKNLKDTVIIKKSKKDSVKFFGRFADIDTDNNTVKKTIELLKENGFDIPPLRVKIRKRIPIMAGLGGSSADAACVIKILCAMFGFDINSRKIQNIAKTIGSDVPYMLNLRACRVSGMGQKIQILENNSKLKAVIAMNYPMSTKQCFEAFDRLNLKGSISACNDIIIKALKGNNFGLLKDNLINDLEKAANFINPKIQSAKQSLIQTGADYIGMTGSGGAYFALTQKKSIQNKIYRSLKGKVKYLYKTDIF